jgi:hypothetical protein
MVALIGRGLRSGLVSNSTQALCRAARMNSTLGTAKNGTFMLLRTDFHVFFVKIRATWGELFKIGTFFVPTSLMSKKSCNDEKSF